MAGVKKMTQRISGLSIRIGDEGIETEHSVTGDTLPETDETNEPVMRKSDTSDSLTALVGHAPSLFHVEELTALPSPISASASTSRTRPRRTIPHDPGCSPLSKQTTFDDPRNGNHGGPSKIVPGPRSNRVLPANLLARLQRNENNIRHASLTVDQPVEKVEMPSIVRHRSQSQVFQYSEDFAAANQKRQLEDAAPIQGHALRSSYAPEIYEVECSGVVEQFACLRVLGEGTFSRVLLANNVRSHDKLVALKVVGLLDSDDADRSRVEMTVRRETELLSRLHHPLIINLQGFSIEQDWAYLVLDYCPGGDLFTLAAERRFLMTPALVRRIFAELVAAIQFLHRNNIVHRDLKLENILIRNEIPDDFDPLSQPDRLLTTITDLGLARDFDPGRPEIKTRCGSEDYAAPEIIMGQPYDGRQTDAWALGALLYSLLEGRLPFDVIPGLEHKMKSKVLHRICRIEWRWVALKERGRYDEALDGAKRVVDNLLRSRTKRWTLDTVATDEWIVEEMRHLETVLAAK